MRADHAVRIVVLAVAATMPAAALAVACTVQTAPVAFGVYDPLASVPTIASGAVDVGCTCQALLDCVAFAYRIDISAGQSGSTAMRQLKAGSRTLNYNLYQDPVYATVWGSGGAGKGTLYLLSLFGSYQRTIVYAQAPAQQSVAPGSYLDAPVVTIIY